MTNYYKRRWTRLWMQYAGLSVFGRFATRMAAVFAPPYKARRSLAMMNPLGYIDHNAVLWHPEIEFGSHVFIEERVIINRMKDGGPVKFGDKVSILRDTIIETGDAGSVSIGDETYIHPYCQLSAYRENIEIGRQVLIAMRCAFYPYDHGVSPAHPIRTQPLVSKGPILIGDNAWLGTGVIVLAGVEIGEGAVIGAGSVVTKNVPKNGIANGVPARLIRSRTDL